METLGFDMSFEHKTVTWEPQIVGYRLMEIID